MKRFFSKFRFVHHRLWVAGGPYRIALLFGPAPLLGCALAAAIWTGLQASGVMTRPPPPWAVVRNITIPDVAGGEPRTVEPARPLPPMTSDGILVGYQAGWTVTAHPIKVPATMDVEVLASTLGTFNTFSFDDAAIDMSRIVASGPKDTLYVGIISGFFVVREAGVYAMTARFERPAGPTADCLTRLGFGNGRIVSNVNVDLVNSVSQTFDVAKFNLRPGLYPIGWAFGCWHDQEVLGPGRMTILVQHPGEDTLRPIRPTDIAR